MAAEAPRLQMSRAAGNYGSTVVEDDVAVPSAVAEGPVFSPRSQAFGERAALGRLEARPPVLACRPLGALRRRAPRQLAGAPW